MKESGLKRPPSAYILYSQNERVKIKNDNPDMSNQEILARVGQSWSMLSEHDKRPFIEQYNENYKIYKDKLSQLESKLPEKKPVNGFVLYANEIRPKIKEQFPNTGQIEITKKIAEKWRNLSEEQKSHYNGLYKQNLNQWKLKNGQN